MFYPCPPPPPPHTHTRTPMSFNVVRHAHARQAPPLSFRGDARQCKRRAQRGWFGPRRYCCRVHCVRAPATAPATQKTHTDAPLRRHTHASRAYTFTHTVTLPCSTVRLSCGTIAKLSVPHARACTVRCNRGPNGRDIANALHNDSWLSEPTFHKNGLRHILFRLFPSAVDGDHYPCDAQGHPHDGLTRDISIWRKPYEGPCTPVCKQQCVCEHCAPAHPCATCMLMV
jgi:hypothetical protein